MVDINFIIKEGWKLQPNPIKLNNILNSIIKQHGCCPCQITHPKCACEEYLINDNCHCNLYIKQSLSEVQGIEAQ